MISATQFSAQMVGVSVFPLIDALHMKSSLDEMVTSTRPLKHETQKKGENFLFHFGTGAKKTHNKCADWNFYLDHVTIDKAVNHIFKITH